MKRVLVTGGTGFVGRCCLTLLENRGFEVHAVTRRSLSSTTTTRWHHLDVSNSADMRVLVSSIRPTHLLHLAWCTKPGAFWTSPENIDWLQHSINLFQWFEQSGGTRIVATGSCAEYDWTTGVCHELTTPCRPNTLYGRAKLAAAAYLDAMRNDRLGTAWARLFFLFGPGASEHRMPGAVISALSRNVPARCSDGTQLRDFLHVTDAARAIVSLLDSEVTGPINICSGVATSIRQMAQSVADLMGKSELLRLGELPTLAHEPALIVGDNSRLCEELGWEAVLSFEEGLMQTVAAWHSNRSSESGTFALR